MKSSLKSSVHAELVKRYLDVRHHTEELAAPLTAEDQCVQSMTDASPTKWHRAHTCWFFETFILCPNKAGYEVFDPDFNYLFNSYYENVGPRHARNERGLITRPGAEEVGEYRKHVDDAMVDFIEDELSNSDEAEALADLIILGTHHEQQHQELILMDIKHVLSRNPKLLPYLESFGLRERCYMAQPGGSQNGRNGGGENAGWENHPVSKQGSIQIGYEGDGFAFDNEYPSHNVVLNDFELASHLVSFGDWLEFIEDGGYETATLWLSDGWYKVMEEKWFAPEYVQKSGDGWEVFTLSGLKELDPKEPVMHISYYEADAFARWAGARLPTEFEWEHAAKPGSRNLPGPVWEWTSSSYGAYPGFQPASGAVGEYNGKFMVNQMVLRGGCWATPEGHIRPSYRNYYGPHTRWHFSGLRMARDCGPAD